MRNLPFAVLVAFIFSIPWQDAIALPSFAISRILGVVLILASLGSIVRGNLIRLRRPSLMLFLTILFVIWAGLSSLWGINASRSLFSWLTYVQLAVMVWLIWELCRTREQHLVLLQAFVLGAYVLAGTTVYQYLTDPIVFNSPEIAARYTGIGSSTGVTNNENELATLMAFGLPLAWYLSLVRCSTWLRWLNLVYLPVAVLGVVLTASRTGATLAAIGLIVIPLTYGYANRSRRVILAIAIGVMGVTVANLVPSANILRIAEVSSEVTGGNVSNRSQIWQAGLEAYSEQPLLGVGVGNFQAAVTPILGYKQVAHNVFINLLTEMGVVGVTLFTLIILTTLLPLLRLPWPDRTVYCFLWLALFASLLPSNDEDAQYTWALLALLTTRRAYVLTFSHSARLLAGVPGLPKLTGRGKLDTRV